MMRLSRVLFCLFATAWLCLVAALPSFGQGTTTAAVGGTVSNKDGSPVGGATVTIIHVESGTRAVTTTRANGQYNATGLRVGGPYTITATAPGLPTDERRD